jgi:hypothetical protein
MDAVCKQAVCGAHPYSMHSRFKRVLLCNGIDTGVASANRGWGLLNASWVSKAGGQQCYAVVSASCIGMFINGCRG